MSSITAELKPRGTRPLTYLDFYSDLKRQNNFYLHFVGKPGSHPIGDIYRSQEHYQTCAKERPRKLEGLAKKLRAISPDGMEYHLPQYQETLYTAYKLMRQYAQSDADLFC
jgi:hypothetical protein